MKRNAEEESTKGRRARVTVRMFLETGREDLTLDLVSGEECLENAILEAAINRPGLALSGFFRYFAHRRIQVIGLAEHTYLAALTGADRAKRLAGFFARRIPCVAIARNLRAFPCMRELSLRHRVPVLRTRMVTKNFVNAATILMENLMAPRLKVQGTMVEIMGIGVLIEGAPGIGKSETALALVKRGHALVSDDITALRLDSAGAVIGAPIEVTRYHMDIRGLDIIHVPSLFGVAAVREEKKLDMVATLCRHEAFETEVGEFGPARKRTLLGVPIPQVFIPVAPGRNIADVVETAALNERLKRLGHDAAKELDEKLIAHMREGRDVSE